MSGCGRKSHYRKGVTSKYSDQDIDHNDESDTIVQVVANRGANSFAVVSAEGVTALAKLPNKFHKVIWVKPKDYVVLEGKLEPGAITADASRSAESDSLLDIKAILSKDQIKGLKKEGRWPEAFSTEVQSNASLAVPDGSISQPQSISNSSESRSRKDDSYMVDIPMADEEEEENDYEEEN